MERSHFQNNLQISRSINPLGMSTINNQVNMHASNSMLAPPPVMSSHAIDKSLALESLLGHPGGFTNQAQEPANQNSSILLSMELARKDGSTRLQMLQSLVQRINLFMESSFKGLVNLCISKQQEA